MASLISFPGDAFSLLYLWEKHHPPPIQGGSLSPIRPREKHIPSVPKIGALAPPPPPQRACHTPNPLETVDCHPRPKEAQRPLLAPFPSNPGRGNTNTSREDAQFPLQLQEMQHSSVTGRPSRREAPVPSCGLRRPRASLSALRRRANLRPSLSLSLSLYLAASTAKEFERLLRLIT